jgi:hypothetical protein
LFWFTTKQVAFHLFCVAIMPYQHTNLDRTTAVHAADSANITVTNLKAAKNWKLK